MFKYFYIYTILFSFYLSIHNNLYIDVEKITYDVKSYNFKDDFNDINKLVLKCEKNNDIVLHTKLLESKIHMANALDKKHLIKQWLDNFKNQINESIRYGINDKELYYTYLYLHAQIIEDGFDHHKEKIIELKRKAYNYNNTIIQLCALLSLYINDKNYSNAEIEIDKIFIDNQNLKKSSLYIEYNRLKAARVIKTKENHQERALLVSTNFPIDSNTLIGKYIAFYDSKEYDKALDILFDLNEIHPNNFEILIEITTQYLWLNVIEDNIDYLNKALHFANEAYSIEPYDEGIIYNLACIYSQMNELEKSKDFLILSFENGNDNFKWVFEDPDLQNLRTRYDLNEIVNKYEPYTISSNYYKEALLFSKILNSNIIISEIELDKFLNDLNKYDNIPRPSDIDSIRNKVELIKDKNLHFYLEYTEYLSDFFMARDDYELAEYYTSKYIKKINSYLTNNKTYISNYLYNTNHDLNFEEYKSIKLSWAYKNLADINLELYKSTEDENEIKKFRYNYYSNLKKVLDFQEIIASSNYLLFYYTFTLGDEYSIDNDISNSRVYIRKAERLFNRIDDIDDKLLCIQLLINHYFYKSLETEDFKNRKLLSYISDAIDLSIENENHEYHYKFLLYKANFHFIEKDYTLAYNYFIDAYKLMKEYNIPVYYLMGTNFYDLLTNELNGSDENFKIVISVITHKFELNINPLTRRAVSAFENCQNFFTYICKNSPDPKHYQTLKSMLSKFDKIEKNEYWTLRIKLLNIQSDLVYIEDGLIDDNGYHQNLLSSYKSLKQTILDYNDRDLFIDYLWIGRKLLNRFYNKDLETFTELFNFYEPLHREYSRGTVADSWFLYFIEDEELYELYVNRIFSYGLDKERLKVKFNHATKIAPSNSQKSIYYYEEVLIESKELNNEYYELQALSQLGYMYGRNLQPNLSIRRFLEAVNLAKKLNDYKMLEILYVNILDMSSLTEDLEFQLNTEYLEISKKIDSYRGQIQAISKFVNILGSKQKSLEALDYIIQGISLKDRFVTSHDKLIYFNFIRDCINLVNNDKTNELSKPINDWAYRSEDIINPKINLLKDEFVYFKNFDLNTLDKDDIESYPFVYINNLKAQDILKKFWDKDFLQTEEFNERVQFLLNLNELNYTWGLINAFWMVKQRIEDIEENLNLNEPNPYSEYPIIELTEHMESIFMLADMLLDSMDSAKSYSGFTQQYREFLLSYPLRLKFHLNRDLDSDEIIDILNRIENISNVDLITESLNHKYNLTHDPLLIDEYNKYSDNINALQLELQTPNISVEETTELNKSRIIAYNELDYFENYLLEKNINSSTNNKFSLNDNLSYFKDFDNILRFSNANSDYYNNILIAMNLTTNKASYFHIATEENIKVSVKNFSNNINFLNKETIKDNDFSDFLVNTTLNIFGDDNINSMDIKSINDKNWLIVTDGILNFFPFELLTIRDQLDSTKIRYLGEFVNITYAPSLTSYVELEKRKNASLKNNAILVSANPNTSSFNNYENNLMATRQSYGNIENVDNEVRSIKETLNKKKWYEKGYKINVFDSKSITEKIFKSSDLENAKYIHIAAHGIHDKDNPKYSGILLGRAENDIDDGILQDHEIFPLNLTADLVTLSSCFSGFGEIDPDEGNLGMYRSFLIAGSKSVIISLWNVDDKSTSILFSKFYEYLKDGNSKSKSLRLAKMYLKNNTKYNHPFYWAPFILMGES